MDWADDVAYSVHDVEDGVHGGYLSLRPLLDDPAERAALCADVAATYSDEPADALAAGARRRCWPTRWWPRSPTTTARTAPRSPSNG